MKTEFHILPVQPPLDQLIQFVWVSKGENDQTKTKILPNGAIELILNFGKTQHLLDTETLQIKSSYEKYWFAGLQTHPIIIQSLDDTNLVGIRFLPGGAYPFLKFPASQLTNKVVEAIWLAEELDALKSEINDLSSLERITCIIQAYLSKKFDGTYPLNESVKYVTEKIISPESEITVTDLVKKSGYSHKHFIQLFKKQVGTSPKNLQRIIRLQRIIQIAKNNPQLKWSDILFQFPFHDAAHFAHDFKSLTGMSPDTYLDLRTFDENHCLLR